MFFRIRNKTYGSNSPIIKYKDTGDRRETTAALKKKTTFKINPRDKEENGNASIIEKKKKQSEINDEETLMNFLDNELKKF